MGSSNKWHLGGPGSVKDFGSGFRVGGFSVLRADSVRGCLLGFVRCGGKGCLRVL